MVRQLLDTLNLYRILDFGTSSLSDRALLSLVDWFEFFHSEGLSK